MHHRMLVTTSLPDGATSEEARRRVYDALIHDDSFCGEGGRFGSPVCGWFVIGGRWSGLLAETSLGDSYQVSVAGRPAPERDALWSKHGGTGLAPCNRNAYEILGYPDDAMLLTSALYAALLADYEGAEHVQEGGHTEFADLDGEELHPDFVSRKWLVVDYHR